MAVTAYPFHTAAAKAFAGGFNLPSDTIKMALFTSSFNATTSLQVPAYTGLANEVASGGGYTTGGTALASKSLTGYEPSTWGTFWSATTWATGSVVAVTGIGSAEDSGGFFFLAPVGGTSTGSAPAWPTVVGETVTDAGSVIWTNIGSSLTTFTSAAVSWSSSTITASYGVIYDSTTGWNLSLVDFGGSQSDSGGTFTVTPPNTGWFIVPGN